MAPRGEVATPNVVGASGFSHARHDHLDCALCHDSTRLHAELTMTDFGTCMDCHHGTGEFAAIGSETSGATDPGRSIANGLGASTGDASIEAEATSDLELRSIYHKPVDCRTCHESGGRPGTRKVRAAFELSVWDRTRTRSLPFDHGKHNHLPCESCHRSASGPVQADCASCHEGHHRVGGPCLGCHEAPPEGVHDRSIHESRSCTDCHEQNGFLAAFEGGQVSGTRDFCVVCHQDRVDHHPGRDCAGCHRLPAYDAGGGK